ncbi:MAG: DUF721 domain-containing protein [Alphaproteobacteria bacterium]|jgi:hypothetical protein|nr:DUF721 domain-containing protein [Alphaproteobacteria bacterium]
MAHPRALAALTRPIARQAGAKASATALGRLALDWPLIVGSHWAATTRPEKLATGRGGKAEAEGATLTLAVDPGEALALQHDLPKLIERINGHFGHRAVGRIKLRQAPIAPPRARPKPAPLPADEAAHIDSLVAAVGDNALRQRLATMGKTLFAMDRMPDSD